MKEYSVDLMLKKKIQKTQYKKHPKWKKRLWVRIILGIFSILMGVYGLVSIEAESLIEAVIMNFGMMTLLGTIPWIIYTKVLQNSCMCVVDYREDDSIIMDENGLKYLYHPSNANNRKSYQRLEIDFENITKLIFNKYHERIDIYGKHCEVWINNIENSKKSKRKNVNKQGTRIRLYLYFDDNEEILRVIEKNSPVSIEIIDCSAE